MSVMKSLLSVAKAQQSSGAKRFGSQILPTGPPEPPNLHVFCCLSYPLLLLLFYVHHVCLARINSQFTVLAQCVIRDGADRPRVYNIWLLCFVLIQFIYAHTILICLRTRSCIMYYFICTHISCVIDRPVYTTESNNND